MITPSTALEKSSSPLNMEQPTSPSARFYAGGENPSTPQWPLLDPVPEPDPYPDHVPPLGHFQGFSAPPSAHQNMSSSSATYGSHVSDGSISPRMPIPNLSLLRNSPQPRVEELSDDLDDMLLQSCQTFQHHVSNITAIPGLQCAPATPSIRQHIESPTLISPSPKSSFTPEYSPVSVTTERPLLAPLSVGGTPATPASPHFPAKHRTYHAPTENEEISDTSTMDGSSETADTPPVASDPEEVISASSDNDGDSTVPPHDSVGTPSSATHSRLSDSGNLLSDGAGHLEEGAAEIHDVCLAVTQRHLEALRVNWEFRHGRDVAVPMRGGPVRHRRGPAGERGSPYARAGPLRGDDGDDDDGPSVDVASSAQRRNSRVPRPTNSLLQNMSHICDLIWRRAQRDREHVLGAETSACRNMGFLFECAETVVLYDADEWERDPERGFEMICQAGKSMCQELQDVEGMEKVNDVIARILQMMVDGQSDSQSDSQSDGQAGG